MKLTQKALVFYRNEFQFGDRTLSYRIDTEYKRSGFSVSYEMISTEQNLMSFRELGLAFLGGIFIIFGYFSYAQFLGFLALPTPYLLNCLMILGGFFMVFIANATRFDAVAIFTPLGRILIFDRAGREEIITEIYRRRTSELRRKYLPVDLLQDQPHEIAKYRWLKEEGVISDDELSAALLQIAANQDEAERQ